MLNQVPRRAGTPDDLNDSIWTIGPTSAAVSGTARPGLHVSLDVYQAPLASPTPNRPYITHRRPGKGSHLRTKPFFSGLSIAVDRTPRAYSSLMRDGNYSSTIDILYINSGEYVRVHAPAFSRSRCYLGP